MHMVQADTYRASTIYYFSGTGNARYAAETLDVYLRRAGIHTEVINLANPTYPILDSNKDTLTGFCYPTHGFNASPVVLKFIWNFPRGNSEVFLLNTRAGLKASKLHLPGIGGLALWLPAILLFFKGYHIRGLRPLDMPSNWISLHPGVRKVVSESIRMHCTTTLHKFGASLVNRKMALKGLIWLPIDLLVTPFGIAYYLFGRFALAKTFYANYQCNSCNACIDQCPVGAVIERDGRPYWTFNCESCMHCMNICPHKAVQTAHGFMIPLWWLGFSVLPHGIMRVLEKFEVISPELYSQYLGFIFYAIMIPVGILLLFGGYRLLHVMLRFRWLNKLISFTSLTYYSWWRRYRLRF